MSEQKNSSNGIWVAIAVFLLLGLVYLVANTGQRHNWHEGFRVDNLDPYGTKVFAELLKRQVGEDQFYFFGDTTRQLPSSNALYLFVGNYAYLDSSEIAELLQQTKEGNKLFFSVRSLNRRLISALTNGGLDSNQIPMKDLIEMISDSLRQGENPVDEYDDMIAEDSTGIDGNVDEVYYDEYLDIEFDEEVFMPFSEQVLNDSSVILSLSNKDWSFHYDYIFDNYRFSRNWQHFGPYPLSNTVDSAKELGFLNDSLVNFISFNYGEGHVYLHLCPLAFSNYALTDSLHFVYASSCLSDLSYSSVIWDEQSKIYRPIDQEDYERSYQPNESPLNFIFSQRSLRWAWYAMLISIFLYLLFGARRNQRIQPVKRALSNTSIQFATALSELYLQQKDHRKIAMLQWKLFLNSVRRNYGLPTNYKGDDEKRLLIQRLSSKSGIEQSKIEDLFESYRQITIVFKVSDEQLSAFYLKLKEFKNERK